MNFIDRVSREALADAVKIIAIMRMAAKTGQTIVEQPQLYFGRKALEQGCEHGFTLPSDLDCSGSPAALVTCILSRRLSKS